jgi:type IV pilus assembly protein PilB
MGLDAYLISSTIRGILAQRLVRVLCDRCKEQYEPTEDLLDSLNIQEDEEGTFFKPIGCTHCKNTGYKGRAGVYELLIPNTEIEDMVIKMAPSHEIERVAVQQGMVTLSEAAKRHVLSGKTSYEEVMRVSLA